MSPFLIPETSEDIRLHFKYDSHHEDTLDSGMGEWDPTSNDFVLRYNSCWRTNANTKVIRTSREKYYCLDCLAIFDLCHG
jgi:hypothetical protein